MMHHTIPGSQIDPSQALPHKTYDQHQEKQHVENHKGCVGGIPAPAQESASGGNGRSMEERAVVGENIAKNVPGVEAMVAGTLTDERIDELCRQWVGLGGVENQYAFARAIEAEVIDRLAATTQASTAQAERGIQYVLDAIRSFATTKDERDFVRIERMVHEYAAMSSTDAQAAAEVRDAALEEAAKACEVQNDTDWPTPLGCAKAIRALRAGDTGEQADGGANG